MIMFAGGEWTRGVQLSNEGGGVDVEAEVGGYEASPLWHIHPADNVATINHRRMVHRRHRHHVLQ